MIPLSNQAYSQDSNNQQQPQEKKCNVVKEIEDGTLVVECGDTVYRAITLEHVRKVEELFYRNEQLEKTIEEYKKLTAAQEKQINALQGQVDAMRDELTKIEKRARKGTLDKVIENKFFKLASLVAPIVLVLVK
jgi:uncharacterized coiled-coil protein SlyX